MDIYQNECNKRHEDKHHDIYGSINIHIMMLFGDTSIINDNHYIIRYRLRGKIN